MIQMHSSQETMYIGLCLLFLVLSVVFIYTMIYCLQTYIEIRRFRKALKEGRKQLKKIKRFLQEQEVSYYSAEFEKLSKEGKEDENILKD